MQIQGPAHIHGPQAINPPHRVQGPQSNSPAHHVHGADELSISREADLASRVRDVPEIRSERVEEIRRQIASGAYETDEKLNAAVDRLLDEIG